MLIKKILDARYEGSLPITDASFARRVYGYFRSHTCTTCKIRIRNYNKRETCVFCLDDLGMRINHAGEIIGKPVKRAT